MCLNEDRSGALVVSVKVEVVKVEARNVERMLAHRNCQLEEFDAAVSMSTQPYVQLEEFDAASVSISTQPYVSTIADTWWGFLAAQLETVTFEKVCNGTGHSCGILKKQEDRMCSIAKLQACSHWFHFECIGTWLRKKDTCPICGTSLVFLID